MGINKRIRLNSEKFCSCAMIVTLVYFFAYDILVECSSVGAMGIVYEVCIVGLWISFVLFSKKLRLRIPVLWLLVLFIVITTSQIEISEGNYYWCTLYCVLTLLLGFLREKNSWVLSADRVISRVGNIHIYATIVLFIFSPWLYRSTMYLFWGVFPSSVSAETAYRAGISRHYSQNAIFCAIMLLFVGSKVILKRKQTIVQLVEFLLCVLALLLTTKRAHILFSFFAMIAVYYFCAERKKGNKLVNVICVLVLVPTIVVIVSPIVPILDVFIQRFVSVDDISSGRYTYWKQAYELFLENKLMGIGWGRYQYVNQYRTSVHNVYLQILCETGVVGFLVFVVAMYRTYIGSVMNYQKKKFYLSESEREMYVFSVAVQTYTLVYCFTGNCFYDISVIIYYFACAIELSFQDEIKRRANEQNTKIYK